MFFKKPLFAEVALLAIAVAFLDRVCRFLLLYWTTEWADIGMHFLGGLFIGIVALFVFFTSGYIALPKENMLLVFVVTIASVLVIGLAWELWEIFMGLTNVLRDQADTILDIIMDTLGGLAAIGYVRQRLWKQN